MTPPGDALIAIVGSTYHLPQFGEPELRRPVPQGVDPSLVRYVSFARPEPVPWDAAPAAHLREMSEYAIRAAFDSLGRLVVGELAGARGLSPAVRLMLNADIRVPR